MKMYLLWKLPYWELESLNKQLQKLGILTGSARTLSLEEQITMDGIASTLTLSSNWLFTLYIYKLYTN